MNRRLIGPIILAAGIICSTLVAKRVADSGALVLAGPLVMAGALLAVGVIDHRFFGAPRARVGVSLILGGIIVAAGAILILRNPDHVAASLGTLGGGASAAFLLSNRQTDVRCDRDAGV